MRFIAVVATAAVLAACSATTSVTQVDVLWSDGHETGPPISGSTSVRVAGASGGGEPFHVDLSGARQARDQWRASAWSGATVAMLAAGLDPRGRTLSFQVEEAARGSSGGGMLAVASWAALDGSSLRPGATLSATVLPNGSLGTVPDLAAQLRAAAGAGISTVLVATGAESEAVKATAADLAVAVQPVATVEEAYEQLREGNVDAPPSATPVFDPGLTELVTIATAQIVEQVRAQAADVPATIRGRRARSALRDAAATAQRLLVAGHPWSAYATVTAAQQSFQMTQAAWSVTGRVSRSRRLVAAALAAGTAAAQQRVGLFAATPLTWVEQFPALADALTWGTGTLAILDQAADRLTRARSIRQLRSVARDVARADYRIGTYLPLQVEAVQQIGAVHAQEPAEVLSLLDGYADLLGQAADANTGYPAVAGGRSLDLLGRATAQRRLWREAPAPDGSQQVSVMRLAAALSYYIASSYLATSEAITAGGRGFVDSQIRIATGENKDTAAQLAGAGFDASYVLWGDEWGRTWARSGARAAVGRAQRGTGLTYQWYATVQGRMLRAWAQ